MLREQWELDRFQLISAAILNTVLTIRILAIVSAVIFQWKTQSEQARAFIALGSIRQFYRKMKRICYDVRKLHRLRIIELEMASMVDSLGHVGMSQVSHVLCFELLALYTCPHLCL